jgi:hypothetical protein
MPTISTVSVDSPLVHQHLVDDELEKDRRDEREQLHEKRRDHDVGERPPVAPNRRQKPAESERVGVGPRPAQSARDQNDFAQGKRHDILDRQLLDDAGDWIDKLGQSLGRADRHHAESPALDSDERRVGNIGEALGLDGAQDTRSQPQNVGGADDVRRIGQPPRQREMMPELRRVGGDAVIARDHCESSEAWVHRLVRRRGLDLGRLGLCVRRAHLALHIIPCRAKGEPRERTRPQVWTSS